MKKVREARPTMVRVETDGSGCRPDGAGSAHGWIWFRNGRKRTMAEVDGLTNDQAEYKVILAALESLPIRANADILSDSENTACQLRGERETLNPQLAELAQKIGNAVAERKLTVRFCSVIRIGPGSCSNYGGTGPSMAP